MEFSIEKQQGKSLLFALNGENAANCLKQNIFLLLKIFLNLVEHK